MPQHEASDDLVFGISRPPEHDDGTTFEADELTALVTSTDYPRDLNGANQTLRNFTVFSFVFAVNPSAALACLALATARLGKIGAWSSGLLYFTYTVSSVTGATLVVKQLGGRNSMIVGMSMYCCYVGCFWVAVSFPSIAVVSALSGAAIGGIGAGILWTGQGSYFSQAAEEHALNMGCEWSSCTASLSGTFAFAYLLEETILHVSSYFLLQWGVTWTTIFALYFALAVLSTISMVFVKNYPPSRKREGSDAFDSQWYKVTAALNLLCRDRKMKYLTGLNAAFGFSGAFVNSFVSGQVLRISLDDTNSQTVGLFVSWTAGVASVASLFLGMLTHDYGKAPVMVFGYVMFVCVAFPFIVRPDLTSRTWPLLLLIYTCQGLGRATFESVVRATFADLFPHEKEGAFANIILQNGLFGSIGYVLTFQLICDTPGPYCIQYRNGTLHDVLTFELLVCVSSVFAIVGYVRALNLYSMERRGRMEDSELKQYRFHSITTYRDSRTMQQTLPSGDVSVAMAQREDSR